MFVLAVKLIWLYSNFKLFLLGWVTAQSSADFFFFFFLSFLRRLVSLGEESARDLGRIYTKTQEYSTFLLLTIPFLAFEWLYLNIPSSSLWFIRPEI